MKRQAVQKMVDWGRLQMSDAEEAPKKVHVYLRCRKVRLASVRASRVSHGQA